jgi:branched-chain amino acid aminotransferase
MGEQSFGGAFPDDRHLFVPWPPTYFVAIINREVIAMSEGVVWINGDFVPESEAVISIRDAGFIYGDAVFDTERTFAGQIFKLDHHLDRLWMSCRYVSIEPPTTKSELAAITLDLVETNYRTVPEGEDLWVTQRITRGIVADGEASVPTVIVESTPLPLRPRAHYYVEGIPVVLSSVRRTPPWALSPRAKTHNYLNMIVATNEIKRSNPDAWAILLDEYGNVAEGIGSNVFLVSDGVVYTPPESHILAGVSRATTIDLAREMGIEVREMTVSPYQLAQADEAFISSTSLCICPVGTTNGRKLRDERVPGPITKRLQLAWQETVGLDFVAQYTQFVGELLPVS